MQIDLSLNSESIFTQVYLSGKKFIASDIDDFNAIRISINHLLIEDIITESAAIRGRNKLQKRIEKHLKKMNKQ